MKFDGATKWSGDCEHLSDAQPNVETITGLSPGTSYAVTVSVYGEIPGAWSDSTTTDPETVTIPPPDSVPDPAHPQSAQR